MSTWQFHSAGKLVFGRGAVARLGELTARLGAKRVLVVADQVLEQAGIVASVVASLTAGGIQSAVFTGGEPEPAIETALVAIEFARAHQPEAILGLGGGSNLDLSKIVAAVLTHGGSPRDYFGFDKIPGPVLPLIGVPTTAGTGSEVSHAAVLTDASAHIKVSTLSQYLRPALAVVDPELTYMCPKKVTVDSGIDALTHAIEAYTATDYSDLAVPLAERAYEGRYPLGECLAEKAIELVGKHLEAAVREPQNAAAREGMALAATLAGLAFSNSGVALVHALEYPLGGAVHCSHGAGNGLLLPHVMRFNLPVRQAALARVARFLGEDTCDIPEPVAARLAIDAVERLARAIGIPARLRDLGATESQLPEFAAKAFAIKRLMHTNPRMPTEAELLELLKAAY